MTDATDRNVGEAEGNRRLSVGDKGPRAPLNIPNPDDPADFCNINTLNRWNIHDAYQVDLDGRPIAGGGFGSVFSGAHKWVPEMTVAIKELTFSLPHQPIRDRDRLISKLDEIAEIAILKELRNSQFVVHIHEYFVAVGRLGAQPSPAATLYIVCEFMHGGELFDCIKQRYTRGDAFTEADVRSIFRVLLEAIQFMHDRHIIHRDLKPANLLLQVPDEPKTLKISDFGQSKKLGPGETTRTVCGTPGYRPPEMYENESYDHSADLFSAGVILFFLLAGYQPFSCYKKHQIPFKTIRCEYQANRDSWHRVSDDAKSLVRSFLAKINRRTTIKDALSHKWMVGGFDASELFQNDLTENYSRLDKSLCQEINVRHAVQVLNIDYGDEPAAPEVVPGEQEEISADARRDTASHGQRSSIPSQRQSQRSETQSGQTEYLDCCSAILNPIIDSFNIFFGTSKTIKASPSASSSVSDDPEINQPRQLETSPTSSQQERRRRLMEAANSNSNGQVQTPTPVLSSPSEPSYILEDSKLVIQKSRGVRFITHHIQENVIQESNYTEAVARRYCRMMLEAVQKLHAQNVAHRNILFANLLVAEDGESILFLDKGMSFATNFDPHSEDGWLTGYCGTSYRCTAPEVYKKFSYNEVSGKRFQVCPSCTATFF